MPPAQASPDTLKKLLGELPPWVNFPEYERMSWLNTILEKLWPSVNEAVGAIVAQKSGEIFENISKKLPPPLKKIGLTSFDLGRALKIGGIKVWCALPSLRSAA